MPHPSCTSHPPLSLFIPTLLTLLPQTPHCSVPKTPLSASLESMRPLLSIIHLSLDRSFGRSMGNKTFFFTGKWLKQKHSSHCAINKAVTSACAPSSISLFSFVTPPLLALQPPTLPLMRPAHVSVRFTNVVALGWLHKSAVMLSAWHRQHRPCQRGRPRPWG